jgi:hypothetical protein
MRFFNTLDADKVQAIWKKFDISLIAEFKAANESMSESDIDEAIKDGKLTVAVQENLGTEDLDEKMKELEDRLVAEFGTEADLAEFEAWKAAN